ncbi:hypothetical protein ABPG75_003838 [Micractinium tetrahymenae]
MTCCMHRMCSYAECIHDRNILQLTAASCSLSQASGWIPVCGPSPAFSSTSLRCSELLQGLGPWEQLQPSELEYNEIVPPHEKYGGGLWCTTQLYRCCGIVLWPASWRLAVAAEADIPSAVLHLHRMLSPLVDLPAWQGDPTASSLAALWRTCPDASNCELPAATPKELTQAIMQAAAASGLTTRRTRLSPSKEAAAMQLMARLACQLGDASLAAAMLQLATGEREDWGLKKLCPRVYAHFGWPVKWRPLLLAVIGNAQLLEMAGARGVEFFEACKAAADACPSTDDGSSSMATLETVALCLACSMGSGPPRILLSGHLSSSSRGDRLAGAFLSLHSVHTAGGQLALEKFAHSICEARAGGRLLLSASTLLEACSLLWSALDHEKAAGCPAFLRLLSHAVAHVASQLGPAPLAPDDWRKQGKLACEGGALCQQCSALQRYRWNTRRGSRDFINQPFGTTTSSVSTQGCSLNCRNLKYTRHYSLQPGAPARCTISKSHTSYQHALQAHMELAQQQRQLADMWLQCMLSLLALPGGAGAGGDVDAAQGEGAGEAVPAPPSKKQAL